MVVSKKIIILLVLLQSCTSIDKHHFSNYWYKENNNYSNINLNGFYYHVNSLRNNEYKLVTLYRNGTFFGSLDMFNVGQSDYNKKDKCDSYSSNRLLNRDRIIYMWGAYTIKDKEISFQWPKAGSGALAPSYKIIEMRGLIVSDSIFRLTWYKDIDNNINEINQEYYFVQCQKPDSLSWLLTDKKLNRLLEKHNSKSVMKKTQKKEMTNDRFE